MSVFIDGINYSSIMGTLNNELEKVNIWLNANKLTINIKKTHYILFHRTRIKNNTNKQLYINGNNIINTKSTKFLGVIIDSKLNWCSHIQYIKNKIAKSNGILYKIRNF